MCHTCVTHVSHMWHSNVPSQNDSYMHNIHMCVVHICIWICTYMCICICIHIYLYNPRMETSHSKRQQLFVCRIVCNLTVLNVRPTRLYVHYWYTKVSLPYQIVNRLKTVIWQSLDVKSEVEWFLNVCNARKFEGFYYTVGVPHPKRVRLSHSWVGIWIQQ